MTSTPVENLFPSSLATKRVMFWPKRLSNYPQPIIMLYPYIPSIRRSIRASWHSRCDQRVADGDKLAQLNPFLGPWSSCSQRCRRLEISLSRLRIGHIRLTHGHLIACEAPPVCGRCQVCVSVSHILVECPTYSVPRNRIFPSLTSVPPRERLSFLLFESPTFISSHF